MLSYDENGNLSEFEENTDIVKCPHCNRSKKCSIIKKDQ